MLMLIAFVAVGGVYAGTGLQTVISRYDTTASVPATRPYTPSNNYVF